MPSERTLQRGLPGSGEQPPSWQDPTTPAGRRAPSTPRERKPALAALAVLLIVGCALGVGYLMIQNGKRVAAVEITQKVGEGQLIPAGAMTEVQIAEDSGLGYVPWNQASQVTKFYAAGPIPAGTLLTNSMVASTNTATNGRDVMGLALKDGQVPRGLQVGQHINIYDVSESNTNCPGHPGAVLAANAIVMEIEQPSTTSGSAAMFDVQVALNPANSGAVACNASNGIVGIAVLPNHGQGLAPDPGTTGLGQGTTTPGGTTSPGTSTGTSSGSTGTTSPGGGSGSQSPGTHGNGKH